MNSAIHFENAYLLLKSLHNTLLKEAKLVSNGLIIIFFRVNEKVATPTSILLMAFNSCCGKIFQKKTFQQKTFEQKTFKHKYTFGKTA
jgi:hypothetical protein